VGHRNRQKSGGSDQKTFHNDKKMSGRGSHRVVTGRVWRAKGDQVRESWEEARLPGVNPQLDAAAGTSTRLSIRQKVSAGSLAGAEAMLDAALSPRKRSAEAMKRVP
jgi:hypothetical protein